MYITDADAIDQILTNKEKFVIYVGAGASVSSGVKTAKQICEEIREKLINTKGAKVKEIEKLINWNDSNLRYYSCIKEGYKSEASRVDYFKRLLAGIKPSFFHYGVSLLIQKRFLRNIAITTNFDKLLELAFSHVGESECQAIRMAEESKFISASDMNKCYLLKLHGDYDTNNILNTREETKLLNDDILSLVENTLKESGLIVLGTAGYEKSVHTMFDRLSNEAIKSNGNGLLRYGLLWGVYMGANKPTNSSATNIKKLLEAKLKTDPVCDEIVTMMEKASRYNTSFSFFPIWGAGEFIFDLIKASPDNALKGNAILYLDHEMRLKDILSEAGLSPLAIEKHIDSLNTRKNTFEKAKGLISAKVSKAFSIENTIDNFEIRIYYGDITKRAFLNFEENTELNKFEKDAKLNKIVVSPDDTFLSAGGGVAYGLLQKGGKVKILNELYKFAPVKKNDIAITSGFDLPVRFIFHVAALEIDKNAKYSISIKSLNDATQAILDKFNLLDGQVLFIPLIGSGTGTLTSEASFNSIFSVLKSAGTRKDRRIFNIVIAEEKSIGRDYLKKIFSKLNKSEYDWKEE